MCGENKSSSCPISGRLGSPPRVRGKLVNSRQFIYYIGITPACAGKTKNLYVFIMDNQDHPRVCGENGNFLFMHVMGTRITPACAGKTPIRGGAAYGFRDHPRVCGENRGDMRPF